MLETCCSVVVDEHEDDIVNGVAVVCPNNIVEDDVDDKMDSIDVTNNDVGICDCLVSFDVV